MGETALTITTKLWVPNYTSLAAPHYCIPKFETDADVVMRYSLVISHQEHYGNLQLILKSQIKEPWVAFSAHYFVVNIKVLKTMGRLNVNVYCGEESSTDAA